MRVRVRVRGRLVGTHPIEGGREQTLGRRDGAGGTGVHQHEAAGTVGDLGLACEWVSE